MPKEEIDRYLGTLDEPRRATLAQLRDTIVAILPEAEDEPLPKDLVKKLLDTRMAEAFGPRR